ncbi:MAG: hypothetical protein PVH87_08390 [Desulfobacteraceae bacterium]
MPLHKTNAIDFIRVGIWTTLALFIAGLAIAGEQRNKSMAQLFEAMASLPQSEENLRREKNMDRLLKALGNLPQPNQKADTKQNIANTLQAFAASLESEDKEVYSALKKWDDYLISINECSNAEHIQVLKSQQVDYFKSIADLEEGIRRSKQLRKAYSASWVDDLTSRFGKGFLKDHRDAILTNFQAISTSDYHVYDHELRTVIYTEAMLYGSYQKYFGMFINFCKKKLNTREQQRLASRKEVAEAFLAVINDVSITSMQNTLMFTERLYKNKAKGLNEELFLFFQKHPLSQNYDMIRAIKDLRKAIQSEDTK